MNQEELNKKLATLEAIATQAEYEEKYGKDVK